MTATAKKGAVGTDLTQGSILKTLLIFAVPIILTNLIQQLYGMVDLMVIGHFVGSIGTVGVATGGDMDDMVTPVAMGFSFSGDIFFEGKKFFPSSFLLFPPGAWHHHRRSCQGRNSVVSSSGQRGFF